jgi:hypothetical protein
MKLSVARLSTYVGLTRNDTSGSPCGTVPCAVLVVPPEQSFALMRGEGAGQRTVGGLNEMLALLLREL